MIDERKEEAAALYALNLADPVERAAFEAELSRDPELRQLVDQLTRTAAGIAYTAAVATPSAQLKNRVMASIDGVTKREFLSDRAPAATAGKIVRFPVWAWVGWAAAASFALLAVYANRRFHTAHDDATARQREVELARTEVRDLRQQFATTEAQLKARIAELQREGDIAELKIARLASLAGNSPEAVAIAVWSPLKQEGVLTVDRLPSIGDDQDYQLWVIDPRYPSPVNSGVFKIDERGTARFSFRPDRPVTAAKFAISRERKGGAPSPQGAIVAAGAF